MELTRESVSIKHRSQKLPAELPVLCEVVGEGELNALFFQATSEALEIDEAKLRVRRSHLLDEPSCDEGQTGLDPLDRGVFVVVLQGRHAERFEHRLDVRRHIFALLDGVVDHLRDRRDLCVSAVLFRLV